MPPERKNVLPPPPLVGLCAWLVPGLGYWLIGQRARGLTVGITILLIFVAGLAIGGIRVVDAPNGFTPQLMLQKPWFIGQVLAGPVTLISNFIAGHWGPSGAPFSHARVWEIGTLYTAIAGMLNLMAIIDSSYRAANGGYR